MTDEARKIGSSQLDPSYSQLPETAKKKTEQMGKDEFLQLLITQLKNQDPLDPMKDEEFAVNLAQFSQLEQLISINDTLGKQGETGGDLSSLASYLGHEVVLNAQDVQVRDHKAGSIRFDLTEQSNVRIELLDAKDRVVEIKDVGSMAAGKHSVELSELATGSGDYKVKVTARKANGTTSEVDAYAAGVVSGFIPGADPVLLVGNREVHLSDIREVRVAGAAGQA